MYIAGEKVISITPPYTQKHLLVLFSAGVPSTITVLTPGDHGAGIKGVQGCGVKTPNAAAVADATAGLANELHIPNGIFGMSVIFAVGLL